MKSAKMTLFIAVSALALASPAMAQQDMAEASAKAETNEDGVNDIVVTAQRREERLQNVPIAISAFSQDDLTKNDVRDISRLAQFTPGFNFGQSGFDTRPAIRGVRTDSVDGNGDPTIGFYIDDVYQSLAVQGSAPIVDVSRVEIARGPQGTLFGRNTYGGAISIVNALPGTEAEGGFDLTYGNYDRIKATGFVSIPLSDTLGVRIAGSREKRDPYVINDRVPGNDIYDRDSEYLRGTLRWAPNDSFEAIVRATYWAEGGTGAGAFGYKQRGVIVNPAYAGTGPRGSLTGTPFFNFFGRPVDGVPDVNGFDIGQPDSPDPWGWRGAFSPTANLKQYAGSGQLRWSNDSIFIRSITSYQDFKYNSNTGEAFGSPNVEYVAVRNTKTYSQELQIGSVENKPLQWIAGLYYLNDEYFDSFYIADPGYAFQSAQTIKTKSYAAYAQASYYITDIFRLTAGGRYTSDKKNFSYDELFSVATPFPGLFPNQTAIQSYACPTGTLNTDCFPGAFDAGRTFKKFTFRLGAEAFLTPENLLYANVSTGFRSGGFNGACLNNPLLLPCSFGPETITAYEVGSKNRFADGKIQLNLSAYYNDFKNLQLQNQFSLPPPSTVSSSGVLNAGAARAYGLEIEAIVRPVPELVLNATAAFVNARFTDYQFRGRPSAFYPVQDIDLASNTLGHTPDVKFTLGAAYDIAIEGFGTITPRASAVISGKFYNTDYNTVIDVQRAYQTVDLGLGWKSEDERFGIDAFVNNLTNKAVLNYAAFGSQTLLASYEPPRFYGIRLSFRSK